MSARETILAAVKKNQPIAQALPNVQQLQAIQFDDAVNKFTAVLESIGGKVVPIQSFIEINEYVKNNFESTSKCVTTIQDLLNIEQLNSEAEAHKLEDVELAIIQGSFAVAENSAIWITVDNIKIRVLPFICQHLAVVLSRKDIVNNMHEAYAKIGDGRYDFGVFIAGPSKTADIEQSLVLGAHGPKSMTVFLSY